MTNIHLQHLLYREKVLDDDRESDYGEREWISDNYDLYKRATELNKQFMASRDALNGKKQFFPASPEDRPTVS